AAAGDHDHLHGVADAGEQDDDRYQHRRRDGAEELQHGLQHGPYPRHRADQRADPHPGGDRDPVPDGEPGQARQYVGAQPLPGPDLAEGAQDVAQRREVEVATAGGHHPPDREQDRGQGEYQQNPATNRRDAPATPARRRRGHWATSARTDGCQARTRRSTRRTTVLIATPSRPVTTTSAYTWGTAPEVCATAIWLPRPGPPMTSSAVMASTSATEAARRTPVITYGRAVGHRTYRTRPHRPRR